jgi:hypothetical protein
MFPPGLSLCEHSWWQAVDEAKEKEKAEKEAAKKKEDW